MRRRALAAATALCGLAAGACREPQRLSWRLRFDPPELAQRARSVEAEVLGGGCAGEPLFSTRLQTGLPGPSPGQLAPGHYGFHARARDDTCEWFAEGCEDVVLPRHGAVEVVLGPRSGLGRDPACSVEAAQGADAGAAGLAANDGEAASAADDAGVQPDTSDTLDAGASAPPAGAPALDVPSLGDPDAAEPDLDAFASSDLDAFGHEVGSGLPEAGEAAPAAFDPSAPKCRELDEAVVACFDFEGSLADLSGHGNDAGGQDVTFEPALSGLGLRVGGKRVTVNDAAALELAAFTIELWVRSDGLANLTGEPDGRTILLDKDQQYTAGYEPNGALLVQLYRGRNNASAFSADAQVALTPGAFAYVAYTYDGTVASLYKDGVRAGDSALRVLLSRGEGGPLNIGSGSPAQSRAFDGLIDALRISNVARAEAAICAAAGRQFVQERCL